MNFKVSIIVPVYNVSEYIEKCILSVLNQTYNNIEIIVVDDASPDDSILKIENIIQSHLNGNKVRIKTHQINKGLSGARNTGIRNSTGDYLFFLDSDDYLPNDAITNLVEIAKNSYPDFVIGGYNIDGRIDKIKYSELTLPNNTYLYGNDVGEALFQNKWSIMAWNKLIKKEYFSHPSSFFYEGIVHEDILWSFQLALSSKSMGICNKKTYTYYIRVNSISQLKTTRNFDSLQTVFTEIVKAIKLVDSSSFPHLYDFLASQRIYFLKELIRSNVSKEEFNTRREFVNTLFRTEDRQFNRHCSLSSQLKLLAYKLPIKIAIGYVKLSLLKIRG